MGDWTIVERLTADIGAAVGRAVTGSRVVR
jgi:hypothetical protein